MHLSQHPTCPCWHLLSICVTLKIAFRPLYIRYPSWNKAVTLAALVIYDMDWASCVFTCTPSLLSVSCGTNIWGNRAWGQVVPWPQPFSVSFLISQSFFRCCCVLGVACYGVECLCLWWDVSHVGWSWLRSFLWVLFLFMDVFVLGTLYFSFRHFIREIYNIYDGGDTSSKSTRSVSYQNSLDWNRESWLTYLTFPCELTALTFFFFFFLKACKQNYHINNFCISWLGIKAGDWLYLSLRWIISSEAPGTFPGLPWCEPFHSGVFEVCYLSQATKFRPWLPLMWMELCDCLLLDIYVLQSPFSQWEQLLNVVSPPCPQPRLGV